MGNALFSVSDCAYSICFIQYYKIVPGILKEIPESKFPVEIMYRSSGIGQFQVPIDPQFWSTRVELGVNFDQIG